MDLRNITTLSTRLLKRERKRPKTRADIDARQLPSKAASKTRGKLRTAIAGLWFIGLTLWALLLASLRRLRRTPRFSVPTSMFSLRAIPCHQLIRPSTRLMQTPRSCCGNGKRRGQQRVCVLRSA